MTACADRFSAIREKVASGQRLSFDDGLALEESNDLFALGSMANLVRERYNGNYAYYNVNTHINPTNFCVYTCDFCAFRADLGEDRAYVMDRDQIVGRAREASSRGATELHLVGGLHHKLPFSYYVDVVRWIKETAPEIHIKAYTAVELEWFCKISRQPVERVLEQLIEAGEPARRRCRNLSPRSAGPDLWRQGFGRELAQYPPDGSPIGPAFQRDDALWPH
jgi:aminodeoxyfutalosine synthase